jgi:phenylalanyl-tRNA synthetase alpha chain
MKQSLTLFDTEEIVLKTLKDDLMDIESISKSTQLDNAQINSIAFSLQEKGLVQIIEEKSTFIFLSDEGKKYAALKLPEIRLLHYLCKTGAKEIPELLQTQEHGMEKSEVTIGLNWLKKKKWAELKKMENGATLLYVTDTGKEAALDPCCEEELISLLAESDLVLEDLPSKESYLELRKRKLLKEKEVTTRKLQLTELGMKVAAGEVQIIKEVSKLTRDDITSGRWKSVVLKPYNVTAPPPTVYPGKKQPFLEFLEEVRRAVIGMGFQEAKGPLIEMEFWNFDALFQAQDHPAREIHDTYYLKDPKFGDLELDDLRKRVKATHENGWTTGSRGWRYPWSLKRASRLILRSQTTQNVLP